MIHLYLHAQYFQQKVEDMYKILVGISRELANIKQIMAEEGNNLHLYIKQTTEHSNNEELFLNLALVLSKVIIQSFQSPSTVEMVTRWEHSTGRITKRCSRWRSSSPM